MGTHNSRDSGRNALLILTIYIACIALALVLLIMLPDEAPSFVFPLFRP